MILAVASGKGGTGKTTVAVNMAKSFGSRVQLLDCDVEEPNAHLFLNGVATRLEGVTVPIPQVDESLCDGCGECSKFCEYRAIVALGPKPLVFPDMCHGCGGCTRVCPTHAIREVDRRIGVVATTQAGKVSLVQGRLDVGVAMAPPVIRATKAALDRNLPAILDAPPGTSCSVIATIRGADLVILVTEPTPFGLHDLKLAMELTRMLGLASGVVVNRAGIGDGCVHEYCKRERIPILMEIPEDRQIAEAYSNGSLIVDALPSYRGLFQRLVERAMNQAVARNSERCRPALGGGS